jgi:hypothetical protein
VDARQVGEKVHRYQSSVLYKVRMGGTLHVQRDVYVFAYYLHARYENTDRSPDERNPVQLCRVRCVQREASRC